MSKGSRNFREVSVSIRAEGFLAVPAGFLGFHPGTSGLSRST